MNDKKYCGTIEYQSETYNVLWDSRTKLVFVSKPNDITFGEGNYGECTARSVQDALTAAPIMLKTAFG